MNKRMLTVVIDLDVLADKASAESSEELAYLVSEHLRATANSLTVEEVAGGASYGLGLLGAFVPEGEKEPTIGRLEVDGFMVGS